MNLFFILFINLTQIINCDTNFRNPFIVKKYEKYKYKLHDSSEIKYDKIEP